MALTEAELAYYRAYRERNRDHINARQREWVRNNRIANPEKHRAAARRHRNGPRHDERLAKNRPLSHRYYHEVIKPDDEKRAARNRYNTDRGRFLRTGVTRQQYEAMKVAQEGVCSICGVFDTKHALHVDHDHQTGRVRKLLCNRCNTAIGAFRDDPQVLLSAHLYLLTAR